MPVYSSYSSCEHKLFSKYKENTWFNAVLGYFTIRYPPIEARILDTLRYVELAPKNATAFSYEFGSILRDIVSVFSSILDKLIRNTMHACTRLPYLTARALGLYLLGKHSSLEMKGYGKERDGGCGP